jgi:predicted anti-sigma-YlaC factor YlaD
MQCHKARAKISAYMDHELDAASSRRLELHLHQCAECREALNDFQELDDMVRELPKIEPGPDFAKQMVMRVSEIAATGEVKRQGRLSLFDRLSRLVEDCVHVVSRARTPSTGTLDEFGDFPPLSMSYIYFRLILVSR